MAWEQRWHPLREEWVIIAAHRQDRPWIGQTVAGRRREAPAYDPNCYLCPGNVRVSGARNDDYRSTFVFDNDAPCVGASAPRDLPPPPGCYRNRPATGVARVICYSPHHSLTLAELPEDRIADLMRVWQDQYRRLAADPEINHVLIFENKGEVVGVSNPHPHCQLYATNFVFKTIAIEDDVCRRHMEQTGRVLFQDIIAAERLDGRRILAENSTAIAFLPYFARYAYEVYVAPLRTRPSLADLCDDEVRGLAGVLKRVLVMYDNLWRMPFPYVMALHQAPTDGADHRGFHFHIEFHPPLRKPDLLKYLAGPEIGGGSFLSDTLPEAKAAELRAADGPHYLARQDRRDS